MRYIYEAIVEPDGDYLGVRFPDIEGCMTFGDDFEHVVYRGTDLLENWLSVLIESKESPPKATFGHIAPKNGRIVVFTVDAPIPELTTMTTQEAADSLGVSTARVRAMIRDGVLDAIKVGRVNMVSTESVRRRKDKPRKAGRPRKELAHSPG